MDRLEEIEAMPWNEDGPVAWLVTQLRAEREAHTRTKETVADLLPYAELAFSASIRSDIPSVMERVGERRDRITAKARAVLSDQKVTQ